MITTAIPLRDNTDAVDPEAYVLDNSLEFRTGRNSPVVVVCPGGAYLGTSGRDAEPVALRFLARSYHVLELRYSVQTQI